jgi:hypothetical protein
MQIPHEAIKQHLGIHLISLDPMTIFRLRKGVCRNEDG